MEKEGFDSLIRRAQDGDPRAVEELLASVRPYLAKVAGGFADASRASASASDLLQEAELRAWQRLGQFQGGSADEETHAKFRTWLVQIVRHIAQDRERARGARKRRAPGAWIRSIEGPGSEDGSGAASLDPPAAGPSPSASLRQTERSLLVNRALEAVRDGTDRAIIRLRFFEGLSLPAIADRLEMTYDQVRERYRRGIRGLEMRLQELKPGSEALP
jgi:RNA polymerase sigma factor (sigma-70 family)